MISILLTISISWVPMEHRHLSNSSQILETDNDDGRNHSEHAVHFARSGASEGSNFVYPAQNTVIDGGNLELQLNHPPNSGGLLSGALTSEYAQYRPQPIYNPFLHASTSGNNTMAQDNYASSSSSSIHGGQTFNGTDGAAMDFRSSKRGPYKRKRHGFQGVSQRGSTSRYYDTGSSSSVSMSSDSRQERQISGSHQPPWDFSSSYGGHGARSRTSFGFEGNSSRGHFSSDPTHNSTTTVPIDRSSMSNLWGQAPTMLPREQNYFHLNSAPHSRPFLCEPGVFGQENPVIVADSNNSASMEMAAYHGEYTFHQNLVPRSVQVNPSQTVRGIRSTYHQRSATGIRASSSNLHPGNVASSDEGFPVFSHGYAGRHSKSHPTSGSRDRSGRPRMSVDRFGALPDDVVVRNHLAPQGLVIVDHAAYGSRDQHMDMRLDIDNMTYEELLALGERIGNVNTGVSEDLISKCLTESIFCSSDQPQDEGRCVICLEEYKNMDDVGTLKLCGHDFHVQCIRKWLAVKNNCPICKSCSLDDKMKNS
ncbi:ubiquitin-protein ligase [Lithospermum erythrorhizon]|uniref:RING-type E3 ubiquitin transferase n=1 Tax=Lithospermum erythrorhizon TaxID=34254 RepID=A0AAV3NYV3_LITER